VEERAESLEDGGGWLLKWKKEAAKAVKADQ